jgi:hypothetical protein
MTNATELQTLLNEKGIDALTQYVTTLEKELKAKRLDEDRDRCLSLAKMYEDSWNRLRDHQWRLEITLWATFLTIVAILACGGVKALSIEIPAMKSISWWAKFWLNSILIAITLLMTLGSIGMQWAFRHFEKLRDRLIVRSSNPPVADLYDWDNPVKVCQLPWHTWNSAVSVAATFLVTGALSSLTYSLLPNPGRSESRQDAKNVNVVGQIESGQETR